MISGDYSGYTTACKISIRTPKVLHVTSDTYAAMLVLNILRSLPTDLAPSCHRTVAESSSQSNAATTSSGQASRCETNNVNINDHTKVLDSILEFIKVELECYERMVDSRQKSTEPEVKPIERIPYHGALHHQLRFYTAITGTSHTTFRSQWSFPCSNATLT